MIWDEEITFAHYKNKTSKRHASTLHPLLVDNLNEETHMYYFFLSLDLIPILIPPVFSGSEHFWGSKWRQRSTKEETWLAGRAESDQRTQERKVTLWRILTTLRQTVTSVYTFHCSSLPFFSLFADAAVGALCVAVAGCALGHLGNVLVPDGFCGYTESAGTHRYAKVPLA